MLCVGGNIVYFVCVTTMNYIIQVYGNALQKYFSKHQDVCHRVQLHTCAALQFYNSCVAYLALAVGQLADSDIILS